MSATNGAADVEASSAFVVKPEVSTWFDVARKVGINVSVGYMFARPNVTVSWPSTSGST